jgi:Tol biopolymer transport system component
MKMFSIKYKKNHARQLLGLVLAVALLTSLFAVTSYSATRSRSFSVAKTNGATSPLIQPQAQLLKANGKIAFVSTRDGNAEIYVMNPDGSSQTNLTNNSASADSPAWSPDGAKIAFVSNRNGSSQIFLMNADGSNPIQLTFDLRYPYHLSWSPDGTRIAFSAYQDQNSGAQIFVINSDGSHLTRLTDTNSDFDESYDPAWSPDGTRIVFDKGSFLTDLYVMNADGSNATWLATESWSPSWSPDGTEIAFTQLTFFDLFDPSSYDIFVINANGSNQRQLTAAPYPNGNESPAWSPDGTKIAFERDTYSTNTTDIYVMNADGSNQTSLTSTGNNSAPAWQPLLTNPSNSIDDAQFFVRQHYLDFLNREPDAGGLAYWTNRITECGSDARCIHERRIGVSAAFFIEQEFQDTGYFVDRFYKASFGRQPNFAEFTADRSKVIGGSSLEANKQAFADEWVQRQAFRDAYPITMSNTEVVNKVFDTAGLTASSYDAQRQQEIQTMNAGGSRALVLRDVIEIPDFKNIPDANDPRYSELKQISQYNAAFVLMQYFGYLHRDVDQSGYDFWLDVLNNREPNNYRGMVCSFLTSSEYQLRFGSMVTRTNADCGQ